MTQNYVADPAKLAAAVAQYRTNDEPTPTSAAIGPPPPFTLNTEDAQTLSDRVEREVPSKFREYLAGGPIPDGYPSRSEAALALQVTLAAVGFTPTEIQHYCTYNEFVWQAYLDKRKNNVRKAAVMLWQDVNRGVSYEKEHPRGPSKPEDFDDLAGGEEGKKAPSTTAGTLRNKAPKRKLVHVRELAEPTPIDWLIKAHVEHETLCIVFGEPASGKSFIALDIATSVARGHHWNGHRTKQGGVVYVAGEGHKGIGRRLQAAAKRGGFHLPDLPMHISRTAIPMTDAKAVLALVDEIQALEALEDLNLRLVVIDTLRRNFGAGDENSTRDMAAFIEACAYLQRTLNCTVLVVHHSGHGDKDRERGSSVITGDFDARYQVVAARPLSLFRCLKLKDSPAPDPISFALDTVDLGYLDEDGDAITSAVPVWHAGQGHAVNVDTSDRPRLGRAQATVLRVMTDMLADDASSKHAPIDASTQGALRVVERTPLIEELIARGISRADDKASAMRIIRGTLASLIRRDKLVSTTDDGAYYWLTSAGNGALRDDDCPV